MVLQLELSSMHNQTLVFAGMYDEVEAEVEQAFADTSRQVVSALLAFDKKRKERVLALTTERGPQGQLLAFVHMLRRTSEQKLVETSSWKVKHVMKVDAPRTGASATLVLHLNKSPSMLEVVPSSLESCTTFVALLLHTRERVTKERIAVPNWSDEEIESCIRSAIANVQNAANKSTGSQQQNHRQTDAMVVGEKESAQVEELLRKHQLDVSEAELFEDRLQREVGALETASVEALLHGLGDADSLVHSIESTERHANDLEEALGIYIDVLSCIKDGADAIDAHSKESRVAQANAQSLRDTLSGLLGSLQVPDGVQDALLYAPLDDNAQLENVMASARTLNERLHALGSDKLSDGWASQLNAVYEKQNELQSIKDSFVKRALSFLQNEVRKTLSGGESSHERLEQLVPVVTALQELDSSAIESLRTVYCNCANSRVRKVTKQALASARGEQQQNSETDSGSERSTRQSSPAIVLSAITTNSSAANFSSILQLGSGSKDDGVILPEMELAQALDEIVSMVSEELDFSTWFLQLEPQSKAESELTSKILDGVDDEVLTVCDRLSKKGGPGVAIKVLGLLAWACTKTAEKYESAEDVHSVQTNEEGASVEGSKAHAQHLPSSPLKRRSVTRIENVLHISIERCSQVVRSAVNDKLSALSRVENARSGRYGALSEVTKLASVVYELEEAVQAQLITPDDDMFQPKESGESEEHKGELRRARALNETRIKERARIELAGELYAKVMAQLPEDVQRLGQTDPKHKHQIMFVNLRAFCSNCQILKQRSGQQGNTLKELERETEASKSQYVDGMLARPFESLHSILASVATKRRSGVSLHELQYQADFSGQEVKRKLHRSLAPRRAEQGLRELSKRLQKHLSFDTQLLEEVWNLCIERLLGWHEQAETVLREGYNETISPTKEELRKMCLSHAPI